MNLVFFSWVAVPAFQVPWVLAFVGSSIRHIYFSCQISHHDVRRLPSLPAHCVTFPPFGGWWNDSGDLFGIPDQYQSVANTDQSMSMPMITTQYSNGKTEIIPIHEWAWFSLNPSSGRPRTGRIDYMYLRQDHNQVAKFGAKMVKNEVANGEL